jgi:hypothetical protein
MDQKSVSDLVHWKESKNKLNQKEYPKIWLTGKNQRMSWIKSSGSLVKNIQVLFPRGNAQSVIIQIKDPRLLQAV